MGCPDVHGVAKPLPKGAIAWGAFRLTHGIESQRAYPPFLGGQFLTSLTLDNLYYQRFDGAGTFTTTRVVCWLSFTYQAGRLTSL